MGTESRTVLVEAKVAALVFALAAPALFALPTNDIYVCYKPDSGQSIYPWDLAAKWFDTTGSGATINREHDHDGQVRGLVGDLERRLVRDRCAAPKRDDRHFQVNATGVSRPSCARE